jgi:hypothetical protein
MNDNDDVLDFIETHRSALALRERVEAEFDAAAADDESLAIRMLTALRIERRLYDALLTAKPRTVEGMAALIRYVDEVSRQQHERGDVDYGPAILAANLKEIVHLAA